MPLRNAAESDTDGIHRLLVAHGWAQRIGDVAQLGRLLSASQRALVAEEDGAIVGFARALTDGLSNGYLSMVVVAASHRRRGIGRALVHAICGPQDGITWVLRAGREGAPGFFEKLGFAHSAIAMERPRRPGSPPGSGPKVVPRIEVRRATADDAGPGCHAVRRSIAEVCAADHAGQPALIEAWLRNKTPDALSGFILQPGASAWVAIVGGGVVGFGLASPAGEIQLLYALPEAVGTGVGTALLAAVEAQAVRAGLGALWLHSTRTAEAFYRRRGFERDGPPVTMFGLSGQPMRKAIGVAA